MKANTSSYYSKHFTSVAKQKTLNFTHFILHATHVSKNLTNVISHLTNVSLHITHVILHLTKVIKIKSYMINFVKRKSRAVEYYDEKSAPSLQACRYRLVIEAKILISV